jgi:hypothetical protein
VAGDLNDDVLASGMVDDGVDGKMVWTRVVARARQGFGIPGALRVDAWGDVIVTGYTGPSDSDPLGRFIVAKLAGRQGHLRWKRTLSGRGDIFEAPDVVLDRAGEDVVAWPAHSTRRHPRFAFAVAKRCGASSTRVCRGS